jgi:hypothetical protein
MPYEPAEKRVPDETRPYISPHVATLVVAKVLCKGSGLFFQDRPGSKPRFYRVDHVDYAEWKEEGYTMNARTVFSRTVLAVLLACGAWMGAGAAFAQEAPPLIPVGVNITIGMHGDRYWDGHRYWAHDEWMRRHPHEHDPWHHDGDHRDEPRHY